MALLLACSRLSQLIETEMDQKCSLKATVDGDSGAQIRELSSRVPNHFLGSESCSHGVCSPADGRGFWIFCAAYIAYLSGTDNVNKLVVVLFTTVNEAQAAWAKPLSPKRQQVIRYGS